MVARAFAYGLWYAALTSALSLAPLPAAASLQPSTDTEQAQLLYDQGRARFEAEDYDGALRQWGNAYGLVSSAPENDHTRYELLYSIALAHQRAYELDHDPSHLRRARDLLLKCQTSVGHVFEGDAAQIESEQKRVRTLLDDVVEEMTDPIASGEPAPQAEPAPPAPAPATEPAPQPEAAPAPAPAYDPAPPDPNAGKGLFAAGLVVIGVGAVGLGLMAGGMAIARRADDFSGLDPNDLDTRADQIRRGKNGNALAVTGAILAVGVPVGIALTVMGKKKMKMAASASAGAGQAGLSLKGRF